MDKHEQLMEQFNRLYGRMLTSYGAKCACDVTEKQWKNATERFARGAKREELVGFLDTTIAGSGKNGYLFTDEKIYYLELLEKPKKIWYDEITRTAIEGRKPKDCDNTLIIYLQDGHELQLTSPSINKTVIDDFIPFARRITAPSGAENTAYPPVYADGNADSAPDMGGIGFGNYKNINRGFDEEKFHGRQGHGFAAEQANNLYDSLTGHDAQVIGDDFSKNGADRIVDGVYIQSKYCATGSRCINECFEADGKGTFRYMIDGHPMEIEVPSDLYDAAVESMRHKIESGQVPGVTDPNEAKNIVRKGHFTYAQAKNIAKAGTVESLTYDAVNGTIVASSAFGVTALITFATSFWSGENVDVCLRNATFAGLKVGGTAFIVSVLSGQLSKAGLNSMMVGGTEAFVQLIGPKASAFLINAFRVGGKPIYGAAAMKSAAKLLRGNIITGALTVAVLSVGDIANIFSGRISGKQLLKNVLNTTGTVAGGTGGWVGGAAIGTAILPGVGTVVGGIVGSLVGGSLAGKATEKVTSLIGEDDADEMVSILQKEFETLANDYLLNAKEAEKCVDLLSEKLDGKTLKDMYASSNHSAFANNLLTPIIEDCTKKRAFVSIPDEQRISANVKAVLEALSDTEDGEAPASVCAADITAAPSANT